MHSQMLSILQISLYNCLLLFIYIPLWKNVLLPHVSCPPNEVGLSDYALTDVTPLNTQSISCCMH